MRIVPIVFLASFLLPAPLAAQQTVQILPPELRATGTEADPGDARFVRARLMELLNQHPPTVRAVFQADPSLLQDPEYLGRYPRLAGFLKDHPEVVASPAYYFGGFQSGFVYGPTTSADRAINFMQDLFIGFVVAVVAVSAAVMLVALIRQVFEYRRWVRLSRVQAESHAKIVERMQSNEELLAYVQSPAGQRFLEGTASVWEVEPRRVNPPVSRILWAVQAGMMLAALGVGFWLIRRSVLEELAPLFQALGVVSVVLGIGAILSAGVSYVISRRLGLIERPKGLTTP